MSIRSQLRIAIAVAMCAVLAAPAALGAGEPKNEPPFTGQAGAEKVRSLAAAPVNSDPAGEPKNQWPFNRKVATETASSVNGAAGTANVAGEPKNDAPFIRSVSQTPVLVRANDGFDWRDAGIGAAATALGLGCVALGAATLRAGGARRLRPGT